MDEAIELRLRADVKPEREQLYFHYDPSQVPDRMGEVMGSIKSLAEEMLYHWKTFPIELPPSITERDSLGLANGGGGDNPASARHKLSFKDLFIAPTFDELEEVALDKNGGQKRLLERQLKSIWRNGEFDVDSIHFPGLVHRWRLTQLLQKGSERAHATLLDDAALALQLMIITARNRFVSGFFSVSQSLKGWGRGLWKLMDIVIGMPSKTPGDLSAKVREEHMHYLVAELDIKTSSKRELNNFCEYVKEQSRLLRTEKHKTTDLRPPPIPYRYQSPKGQDVDLRLFNKDLINNCLPILSNILTREAKGWHIQYRQRLLRELRGKGLSLDELSERLNDAVMEEYLRRVFASVLNNAELESLQPGIGTLLVAQAQAVLAMKQAVQNLQFKMQMHKEQLVSHLKKQYPVKSRIQAWMDEQLQAFEEEFITQNLWSAHEEAISLCEEQNLHQAVYFLRRDLNFIKEREAILKKELSKVKDPTRVFIFHTRIWFPRNWVIWKMHHGNIDVIPTVIKQKPPLSGSKKEASYTLEKTISRTTSTRYPFWRWWNYLHRTWSWLWNAMFFFGVVVPWCSPVGLRALLGPEPFMPDLVLSQATGVLYPDESSLTHTLSSRLHRLWNHVHHSIHKFEDTPDTGFLGKDVTRFLNRLWNYVFKGAFGSVCLVLTFPIIALLVSSLSLAVAIIAPLWVPAFTLLAHLGFILVYDVDCPDERGNRVLVILEALVWNLLMQGCLQPVSACLVGAVCCPIASLSILAFGLLRRGGRGLWDTLMFHTIIKGRGRVPAGDGFVARRIAGPGLASNYFFQIRPEQALAAVEASIERDELEAWRQNVLQVIDLPRDDYRKFVEKCFRPFSAGLIDEGVYKQLCMETAQYATDLRMKVEERERNLYLGLTSDLQRKIKLPERDLKLTILHTAQILQQFYPERYIQRLSLPESQFWENHQLLYRDWRGLACLKLTQIFSKAFLIPLEETDKCFELKVEHINLSRYGEMLVSADFHDDLDVVLESHSPAGDINAKPPHLDVGYFNPSQRMIHTTRDKKFPWTRSYRHKVFDKLEIPLPIPHPAYVAISIYNRENDRDEIDLTDPLCQRIVRASQEVPYVDLSDLASLDLYDPEVSTPDNATAESLTVVSHLAQQERTFSEDDDDDDDELAKSHLVESPFPESATSPTPNSETYSACADMGSTDLGKLVYAEPEKDTSCMVFVDDDNIGAGITDYDINQDP